MAKPNVYHIIIILLANLWLGRKKIRQRTSQKLYMCQGPLSKDEIIGAFQNNHYNFKKTLWSLASHNYVGVFF